MGFLYFLSSSVLFFGKGGIWIVNPWRIRRIPWSSLQAIHFLKKYSLLTFVHGSGKYCAISGIERQDYWAIADKIEYWHPMALLSSLPLPGFLPDKKRKYSVLDEPETQLPTESAFQKVNPREMKVLTAWRGCCCGILGWGIIACVLWISIGFPSFHPKLPWDSGSWVLGIVALKLIILSNSAPTIFLGKKFLWLVGGGKLHRIPRSEVQCLVYPNIQTIVFRGVSGRAIPCNLDWMLNFMKHRKVFVGWVEQKAKGGQS